jgi:hypothetical protein
MLLTHSDTVWLLALAAEMTFLISSALKRIGTIFPLASPLASFGRPTLLGFGLLGISVLLNDERSYGGYWGYGWGYIFSTQKRQRVDEQKDAAPQQNQSAPEIPPPVPPSVDPPNSPPNPAYENAARPKKMNTSDKIMVWATCVIAAGTLVSAAAIYEQWREMVKGGADTGALVGYAQRQADDADKIKLSADKQATAAQKFADTAGLINSGIGDAVKKLDAQANNSAASIKTTQEAIRLEQRAWVVVKGTQGVPELGKPWGIRVVFTNNGTTPARNTRISCNVEGEPRGTPFRFKKVPVGSSFLMTPNVEQWCVLFPTSPQLINQDALNKIANRDIVISIFGTVTYDDIFHQSHWYTFCREMETDAANWEECETGGDATGDGKPPN